MQLECGGACEGEVDGEGSIVSYYIGEHVCLICEYWNGGSVCRLDVNKFVRSPKYETCDKFAQAQIVYTGKGCNFMSKVPDNEIKPPLGIESKEMWEEQRMWNLVCAIARAIEDKGEIKHAWLAELRDKLITYSKGQW